MLLMQSYITYSTFSKANIPYLPVLYPTHTEPEPLCWVPTLPSIHSFTLLLDY